MIRQAAADKTADNSLIFLFYIMKQDPQISDKNVIITNYLF